MPCLSQARFFLLVAVVFVCLFVSKGSHCIAQTIFVSFLSLKGDTVNKELIGTKTYHMIRTPRGCQPCGHLHPVGEQESERVKGHVGMGTRIGKRGKKRQRGARGKRDKKCALAGTFKGGTCCRANNERRQVMT